MQPDTLQLQTVPVEDKTPEPVKTEKPAVPKSARARAAPKKADEPKAESTAVEWTVLDKLCRATDTVPRIHEVIVGDDGATEQYAFSYKVAVSLPPAIAMQFARHPEGFDVRDGNGKPVELKSGLTVAEAGSEDVFRLQPGQVIVHLDKLKPSALLEIAAKYPGGDRFTQKSKADDVIGFIIDAQTQPELVDDEESLIDEDGDSDEYA